MWWRAWYCLPSLQQWHTASSCQMFSTKAPMSFPAEVLPSHLFPACQVLGFIIPQGQDMAFPCAELHKVLFIPFLFEISLHPSSLRSLWRAAHPFGVLDMFLHSFLLIIHFLFISQLSIYLIICSFHPFLL